MQSCVKQNNYIRAFPQQIQRTGDSRRPLPRWSDLKPREAVAIDFLHFLKCQEVVVLRIPFKMPVQRSRYVGYYKLSRDRHGEKRIEKNQHEQSQNKLAPPAALCHSVTQLVGNKSRTSVLPENHCRGAITIFSTDGFSHAPHQLNELFAMM